IAASAAGNPAARFVKKNNTERSTVLRMADFQFHFLIRLSWGCRNKRSKAPPTLTPFAAFLSGGKSGPEFLSALGAFSRETGKKGNDRPTNCKPSGMETFGGLLTSSLRSLLAISWGPSWRCFCKGQAQSLVLRD